MTYSTSTMNRLLVYRKRHSLFDCMKSITFCYRKDVNLNLNDDAILNQRLINMASIAVAFRRCSRCCNATSSAFALSECEIRRSVSSTSSIVSDTSSASCVNTETFSTFESCWSLSQSADIDNHSSYIHFICFFTAWNSFQEMENFLSFIHLIWAFND